MNQQNKLSLRDLCLIALFTGIISIFSQISIPLPSGIPMTLQTFIIQLAGVILGAKRGATATLVYVLLGAIGLPVYAGGVAGFGTLFGVTGGFLWAFPIMALLAGYGAEKGTLPWLITGLIAGVAVDYAVGALQFMLVSGSTLKYALLVAVVPYLPLQAVKTVLVAVTGLPSRRLLIKSGVAL